MKIWFCEDPCTALEVLLVEEALVEGPVPPPAVQRVESTPAGVDTQYAVHPRRDGGALHTPKVGHQRRGR